MQKTAFHYSQSSKVSGRDEVPKEAHHRPRKLSVEVLGAQGFAGRHRQDWERIRSANPELNNPFFSIDFIDEMSNVRSDVRVAVIRSGKEIVAYFPFQELKPGIATQVGESVGCMQGMICAPGFRVPPRWLLNRCQLKSWRFEHLISSQKTFQRYHYETFRSRSIDFSSGHEQFLRQQGQIHGKKSFNELSRKYRRLEKQHGPVRFEIESTSEVILNRLVELKSMQMAATGRRDLFQNCPWVVDFLRSCLRRRDNSFRGLLSVLYADDEPVSIHFGLLNDEYLHGLFFTYNRKFSRYSPGMLLVMKMVEALPQIGVSRRPPYRVRSRVKWLDLGSGV